jgi:hypothetical protein
MGRHKRLGPASETHAIYFSPGLFDRLSQQARIEGRSISNLVCSYCTLCLMTTIDGDPDIITDEDEASHEPAESCDWGAWCHDNLVVEVPEKDYVISSIQRGA